MKQIWAFLIILLLSATADASLQRGEKGDVEDVILVGAADWHSIVAATPVAIWSEDNQTVTKPLLILPKEVNAGERMGWAEQADLERYGASNVLHTFKSADISAVIIHGEGDVVKSAVEAAHKEGLEAYVTATLELPKKSEPINAELRIDKSSSWSDAASAVRSTFMGEMGLRDTLPDEAEIDPQWLQVANPYLEGDADYFCPVNPEVREALYDRIETLIDEYDVDGVVLYHFGFQDESFCFCDACKEEFYKDTGMDMTKIYASGYNQERWKQWRQEQVLEIMREARNITSNLGPVKLGVAVGNPFDRSQGYNFVDLSRAADFAFISPVSSQDGRQAAAMTDRPVYVRLSDNYVEYVLSTQNVEGTVKYIEDLTRAGVRGFAFEYNVVYTPLWYELEPPTKAARWLLEQLGGETLGIGNVSWNCDSWISANSSSAMAEELSRRWASSPGAVVVGEDYSAGLKASALASYLNWPVLFAGVEMPLETSSALQRLNVTEVVSVGPISDNVKKSLQEMNLTVIEGSDEMLLQEMRDNDEDPDTVVFTNSRDLSLQPPIPKTDVKRDLIGDLLARVEVSPSQVAAEELGEIVRLNITLTNSNSEVLKGVNLLDSFPRGRLIAWPRPSQGTIKVTDLYSGQPSDRVNAFLNGTLLRWNVGQLAPGESASVVMEVEVLYPMDVGWNQPLDGGVTVSYEGLTYNQTLEKKDDWPVMNITYPAVMPPSVANISWNIERAASFAILNIYAPDGMSGRVRIKDTASGKLYAAKVPLLIPGIWKFNIEAGDGYTHRTENCTINVVSDIPPMNITAFAHTKVPRLSLVAAPAAAAHKAILVDVAKDPQEIDPQKEEEAITEKIKDIKLSPQYLLVVGDPGSLPFVPTGLRQTPPEIAPLEYEVYRDYQLQMDDDNYTETATGRLVGLSVYDASQLLARTLAYDSLNGTWKGNALVISSPPLTYPQDTIGMSIRDYLTEAGLKVRDLRYEEASYQLVDSQMNNGQNIVHFNNHGSEESWALSEWAKTDRILDESHVKQLTLAPQTTTAAACATSNLKGYTLNVSGTKMYLPMRLEDSIAMAFIRAGSVNYVGSAALSWIFVSDDHAKRLYQALVFENATLGEAVVKADNLYRMKVDAAGSIKKLDTYDELLPSWGTPVQGMLNQTASMNIIIGDPSFRPALPKTPPLPYVTKTEVLNETGKNVSILQASVVPEAEMATDWLYWIDTESVGGKLKLNSPPAIIAEVYLPKDADKIVVKENGLAIWHDEDVMGDEKKVSWPIVRPRLGVERDFQVEYVLIPGEVQVINVTAGWNAIAIHLDPKEPSIPKHLKNKPYRGIFSVAGKSWDLAIKDATEANISFFEPGSGYLIDSVEDFTIELPGKPVELPYRLKLQEGWNLIGVPLNHSVDAKNLTVNAQHKRYSHQDAVDKGLISAFIWSYDGDGWRNLGANDSLVPGKAYMIEAVSECRLEFRE